jgi:hypothetical protein
VVKSVDAGDSKSPGPCGHDGSTPSSGTIDNKGFTVIFGCKPFIHYFAESAQLGLFTKCMQIFPALEFSITVLEGIPVRSKD